MTDKLAKSLKPEISFVKYAGSKYKVSNVFMFLNTSYIEIYDEPPSKHTDLIQAENCEYLK